MIADDLYGYLEMSGDRSLTAIGWSAQGQRHLDHHVLQSLAALKLDCLKNIGALIRVGWRQEALTRGLRPRFCRPCRAV